MSATHLLTYANKLGKQLPSLFVVGLDPGNTTGYSYWHGSALLESGELRLHKTANIVDLLYSFPSIDQFVVEEYRIYPNRAKQHIGHDLFTPRIIGAVEAFAHIKNVPVHFQPASLGKSHFTDTRLKHLGLFRKGHRHANDAIRHVAHWLIFTAAVEALSD